MICERCGEPIAALDHKLGTVLHPTTPSIVIDTYDLPYHRSIDICFVALAKAGRLFVSPVQQAVQGEADP